MKPFVSASFGDVYFDEESRKFWVLTAEGWSLSLVTLYEVTKLAQDGGKPEDFRRLFGYEAADGD